MKTLKCLIVLLSFLGQFNSTIGGTIDPTTPDSKYVDYGKDFHYVFKICGTDEKGMKFCGSCVAIDSHHILTAAHVVENSKECHITINDKRYDLSEVTIHKSFTENQFGVGDIAIGYCENDFELDFYPELYDKTDEVNEVCCISGYGLTGTFLTGPIKSDNLRRAGSNIIHHIEKNMLICTPSRRNHKDYTSLEFCIASGDSGGGLFINGKLAGINSCVMNNSRSPDSKYGDESGHTRISDFIGWIHENKRKMDKTPKK